MYSYHLLVLFIFLCSSPFFVKTEDLLDGTDLGHCTADGSCDGADDNGFEDDHIIYDDGGEQIHLRDFMYEYGITESLFDLDGKSRIDIILEKAKLFADSQEDDENGGTADDRNIAEKKLFFLEQVNRFKNIVIKEQNEREQYETEEDKYEFPPLTRLEPGEIGHVEQVELEEGKIYKRITRSIYPPVFEIPDFLTDEECDRIIEEAQNQGLEPSNVFGDDVLDELSEEDTSRVARVSEQAWLRSDQLGEDVTHAIHERVAKLTEFPYEAIRRSEYMQVVNYGPRGHYHAHIDTIDRSDLPCCFQTRCGDLEDTKMWSSCCRLCRYITVLYYLNDVELGGETAFPLADMEDNLYNEKLTHVPEQSWYNLSHYCYNASLVVKPEKGKAVMWYSHFIGPDGYLGEADLRSHHGGCDVLAGTKWVANTWVSASTYKDRFKPSLYYN